MKKLFDIPIYSTSKMNFRKKWENKKRKHAEWLYEHNYNFEDAEKTVKEMHLPYSIWDYNQIIGYISLSIDHKDIVFDLYMSKNKRFPFDSQRRSFIRYMPTVGLHFYAGDMSDQVIKEEIKKFIEMVNKDFLYNKRYIDLSIYNNIIDYLNIKKIN